MILTGQAHSNGDERKTWMEREKVGKIIIEREEEEVEVERR